MDNSFKQPLSDIVSGLEGLLKNMNGPMKEATKNMTAEDKEKLAKQFKELNIAEEMKKASDVIDSLKEDLK